MNGCITNWSFGDTLIRTVQNTKGYGQGVTLLEEKVSFVAKDVATALGYEKTQNMTDILDEDEITKCPVETSGGVQEMIVMSEAGVYHAVFMSRKESAKAFRKWVTGEVLPQIRKTGSYGGALETPGEKARSYILNNLDLFLEQKLLTPKIMELILKGAAQEAARQVQVKLESGADAEVANAAPYYKQEVSNAIAEWGLQRLTRVNDGGYVFLKQCYEDFLDFVKDKGWTVHQTFFTRRLRLAFPEIRIGQKKPEGSKVPLQIIPGWALQGKYYSLEKAAPVEEAEKAEETKETEEKKGGLLEFFKGKEG